MESCILQIDSEDFIFDSRIFTIDCFSFLEDDILFINNNSMSIYRSKELHHIIMKK